MGLTDTREIWTVRDTLTGMTVARTFCDRDQVNDVLKRQWTYYHNRDVEGYRTPFDAWISEMSIGLEN